MKKLFCLHFAFCIVLSISAQSPLREHLSASDYRALAEAHRAEAMVAAQVARLGVNFREQVALAGQYDTVRTAQRAAEILARYENTVARVDALQDSIRTSWEAIYDNKSYAYTYLLDKLGHEQMLEKQDEAIQQLSYALAEARSGDFVAVLPDYVLQKRHLLAYEIEVATLLKQPADSLRAALAAVERIDYRLPVPTIAERNFLVYEPLTFAAAPSRKPAADLVIYPRGTIFRVLLGEYKYPQQIETFRQAQPLYLWETEWGTFRYFAGGFATKGEAVKAQAQARARGFRTPELVVWYDGAYVNLTRTPEKERTAITVRTEDGAIKTVEN